uniref:Uncharacterized protein n=1 Tax=Desertifilum tharense IPPAS B-1220 TaxID=1781255 RepID=A0ACD5GWH8_9CYAN
MVLSYSSFLLDGEEEGGEEGSWELGVRGWGRRGWGDGGNEGNWELGVRSWGRRELGVVLDTDSAHRYVEASYSTFDLASTNFPT